MTILFVYVVFFKNNFSFTFTFTWMLTLKYTRDTTGKDELMAEEANG